MILDESVIVVVAAEWFKARWFGGRASAVRWNGLARGFRPTRTTGLRCQSITVAAFLSQFAPRIDRECGSSDRNARRSRCASTSRVVSVVSEGNTADPLQDSSRSRRQSGSKCDGMRGSEPLCVRWLGTRFWAYTDNRATGPTSHHGSLPFSHFAPWDSIGNAGANTEISDGLMCISVAGRTRSMNSSLHPQPPESEKGGQHRRIKRRIACPKPKRRGHHSGAVLRWVVLASLAPHT